MTTNSNSNSNGLFISFEGPDRAGKSSQAKRLKYELDSLSIPTVLTREPGGTPVGNVIRSLILTPSEFGLQDEDISQAAEVQLFMADRAAHLEQVILPELANGKVVITDRYVDSSVAYQVFGRQGGLDMRAAFWSAAQFVVPAITFLLDADPEVLTTRAGENDRIEAEGIAFQQRVRDGLLTEARVAPHRFIVLDALESAEKLSRKILKHVIARYYAE
jgi:dTMP kinase